jgi:UPF0042 nucleotide-binding protein
MSQTRLVIISGLSGSGKSTAARALEDEGFFVVDNLPVVLLPEFLKTVEASKVETSEIAVVLDVRNREFLPECEKILDRIAGFGYRTDIIFLDSDDSDIKRRFSETRRRHPLDLEQGVSEGIRMEREQLSVLRARATVTIDSSQMTPHQLRARVVRLVYGKKDTNRLTLQLQSFGFRYGLPPDSDIVMDVRFLPNPHFVPELQPLTGSDERVRRYVLEKEECEEFLQNFKKLLAFLIPNYQAEGKNYLTISIGCTGGRHRSVAIVEELARTLPADGLFMKAIHRDVIREEIRK